MHYETGKSFAWFMSYGRGYLAVFAYPGNRRTRYMTHPDGKAVVYATSHEAIAAAQLQVRRQCEPDIRSSSQDAATPKPEVLDVAAWRAGREKQRQEDRQVFRGLGKGFLTVETKRRRSRA